MNNEIINAVNHVYESFMLGGQTLDFDKIGFFNVGYWKGVEGSVEIAQINLIETLAAFLIQRSGRVLDAACGKGASTKYLTKYFDPKNITGINISENQIKVCRTFASECTFRLMSATDLEFPDASFDNLLCIEAAVHFMTRRRFFDEASRVLKPGGRLAMSDLVFHDPDHLDKTDFQGSRCSTVFPKENCLPTLDAYATQLQEAGFRYVRVEDVTENMGRAKARHSLHELERQARTEEDYKKLREIQSWLRSDDSSVASWCLAFAIK